MKPTCIACGAEFDHGCNSQFCSLACEDRFSKALEHHSDMILSDTHSSDVDPGDYQ